MHNTPMKRSYSLLLGVALLVGCAQNAAPIIDPAQDTIPYVPRVVADSYPCTSTGIKAPLAGLLGPDQRDTGNLIAPRLTSQATPGNSVWDLLYETKVLINELYFGYSNVDLQDLHQSAYVNFKKVFPQALSSYNISSLVDAPMNTYIDGVQDEHTYYLNASEYAAYQDTSSNSPLNTPLFGVSLLAVPGADGSLIQDVRGDGPAFAAGLRRGDVVLSIDGVALKRTVPPSGSDDSAQNNLYSKIIAAAAAKQTPVPVIVRRGTVQRTVSLTGAILNGTRYPWGEMQTAPGGGHYFYLRIPSFSGSGIGQKVHDLVAQAAAAGAQGIIVDLRNNGGGLLVEYVAAVAAFAPAQAGEEVRYLDASRSAFTYNNGSVKYTASCKTSQTALTLPRPTRWTGKVAVLLNGNSASASEMFSQNIAQGGQATLIGEETFGVGNTSTFILATPNTLIDSGPDGAQAVSITAGRIYLGDQPATKTVRPQVNVTDDRSALAQSGVDTALQTAYNVLGQ